MSLETDPICLALEENGDVVIPMRYLAGLDAVVQGVVTRLRMIRGELRWDLSIGVPYFERDGATKSSTPELRNTLMATSMPTRYGMIISEV